MYLKITNEAENHNGLQYHDGLIKHILDLLSYEIYIREVQVPEDADFVKDSSGNKYRAFKVFLKERKDLREANTWKYLIENGADIHAENNYALRYAACNGHLEIVKYLVEHGVDIHANNDEALRWSAKNGKLEIVKYLVQNGADIHANNDEALRWSEINGHLEVLEYLKSLG